MDFAYRFPAVRGRQARRDYYIAMVPLCLLARLFVNDDEFVLPEYRAQRKLNTSRIPVIKRYMLDNRDTYVFSALAAAIDGEYRFVADAAVDTGLLEVDLNARFLIVDGQHRKAAILAALEEDPTLGRETISIVLYEDRGLSRSQQMFTDLNKHAVKTSNSIAELYDSRDPLAVATRRVIAQIPFFNTYTDKEKDILGKYSSSLFTLNTFYHANRKILRKHICDPTAEQFLLTYWTGVVEHMALWNELTRREINKISLRENYIVTQSVCIQALGYLGGYLWDHPDISISRALERMDRIDWSRGSALWQRRTIRENGKIINSEAAALLTCIAIKGQLGLALTAEEAAREHAFDGENSI